MKNTSLSFRRRVARAASLTSVLLLSNAQAQAATLLPPLFVAQAAGPTGLANALGFIVTLVIVIGFIMGLVMVIQGWRAIDRGDEGKLKILGGVGIALAFPIMKWIFSKIMPGVVDNIQPGTLN